MKNLLLKPGKSGALRWQKAGDLVPPAPSGGKWQHKTPIESILKSHSAQWDSLHTRSADNGHPLDPETVTQAKGAYMATFEHMLRTGNEHQVEHLRKLRVMPLLGQNDALYNPAYHAIGIGTETLKDGWKEHTAHPALMPIHELGHALDFRDGKSHLGEELSKGIEKSKKDPYWVPEPLKAAIKDNAEWGPRLLEMAVSQPEVFHRTAEKFKAEHGVDLYKMMHTHMAFHVPLPGKE